ncbi:MAG: class I SAM-dependent methyltransferase [Chlamydiia bacterium]|nr:class I SAM-dependent methyltransferase [Chlamydiia bacterium]
MNRWDYLKFLITANCISIKRIAEVGVWAGENAKHLRHFFPEAHIYLIDPFYPDPLYLERGTPSSKNKKLYEATYQALCKAFENDPLTTILRATSVGGSKQVPDNLDLVFIDGDHSYEHVKQDILTWKPKMRPGGLLAGHDFRLDFPEVMRAVHECLPERFIVGKDAVWATIT